MQEILHYFKNRNLTLFEEFENSALKIYDVQNYIPIYNRFFNLEDNNNNLLNLNNKYRIQSIGKENKFRVHDCEIYDNNNNKYTKSVFFKCSPLIDPVKYMVGKYDHIDNVLKLPTFNIDDCHKKVKDYNNSAYIDGFFSFLSSKLLNNYNMFNCIDFYGGFLGYQSEFHYDIYDDVEYLLESDFFNHNKDQLFTVDEDVLNELLNTEYGVSLHETRDKRKRLKISSNKCKIEINDLDDEQFEDIFVSTSDSSDNEITDKNIVSNNNKKSTNTKTSSSSFSSRYSDTNSDDSMSESDSDEDEDEDDSDMDSQSGSISTTSSDEEIYAKIFNFPIELICLEKCENTLDNLMKYGNLDIPEWRSILMQVIMNLLMFQKSFNFTHNDLHTNNIMYIETQREFLYYKVDNTYYKVPTFGKLFKIIDFGRAIYKFNGNTFCSDSYHKHGDAATQYNIEPYFNDKKPRLEPHFGFDLCRLGCALYDDLVEEDDDITNPLSDVIKDWCTDDKGKNILYKTNGKERYPDFKLYIMIARCVHNPTPKNQLSKDFFAIYETTRKKINKKTKIMDIDALPCFI